MIPKASADFVCAMEEVLEVYQRAHDPLHPVLCLDEARRQLMSETQQSFTKDGVEHIDYQYRRQGVAEVFMVCEPLGGRRQVEVTESHTSQQWAKVVGKIVEEWWGNAERITLVQDNLSAHRKAALYEVFTPERARAIWRKIDFVFIPKHGSWLNMAEIELSILSRQGLTERVASLAAFSQQVQAWVTDRNDKSSKVDWQFSAADARIKLKRLYPSTIDG